MSKAAATGVDRAGLQDMLKVSQKKATTCFICKAIDVHYQKENNKPQDIEIGGTTMPPASQLYHVQGHHVQ